MFRTKTDVISKILSATDKMNVKCFEILVGSYVIVSSTFNEIILGLFIAIKVDIKYNKKFFKIIGLYKSQTFGFSGQHKTEYNRIKSINFTERDKE